MRKYVIEMVSAEGQEYIGPFISEEEGREKAVFVSEATEEKTVGSVFSEEEVEDYRLALEEGGLGLILTCKMPLPA